MTALRRRIGLAQIGGGLAGIEASLTKHLEHIAAARDKGCDVLLFPELSLVPYACGPRVLDLALDRKSDVVGRLAEASAGMTTVFGFVEEGVAAQYYNTERRIMMIKALNVGVCTAGSVGCSVLLDPFNAADSPMSL
jgi:predicted amidohydrolase